jgi:hypothetical protein
MDGKLPRQESHTLSGIANAVGEEEGEAEDSTLKQGGADERISRVEV